MQRLLLSLAAVPLFAVATNAQCFDQNFGVLAPLAAGTAGYGDDVQFDLQPLNFNFPMAGNAAAYTHASISDNGIIYLTTGAGTTAATGAGNGYQNTAYFVGDQIGDDPRIAPLFMDMWSDAINGGGVWVNNTIPGKFVVTWENVVEWYATTQPGGATPFTFQCQMFDTGEVKFYYGPNVEGATSTAQIVTRVGVSQGNGVVDPGMVDLTTGNTYLTDFVMYEEFASAQVPSVFDLAGQVVQIINAGTGYIGIPPGVCAPAANTSYGAGCYDISNAFYELVSAANMDLGGQIVTGTSLGGGPGTGYFVTTGPGTGNLTPGAGATSIALGDDDVQPAGGTLGLEIGSNCWVANGTGHSAGYVPSITTFLNQPGDEISAWTDLQPNASGSGLVYYEEVGFTAIVTYDGVWGWNTTNPNTIQFTWDTLTGNFTIEFGVLSTGNPENWLVGFSPAGPSNDGGSLDLDAGPFTVASSNIASLSLSASGAPLSTATTGSTVTYTTDNQVESAPGVYIAMNIISLSQADPGLPLGFLGAPGCSAYVGTLDLTQAMVGVSPSSAVSLAIPAGAGPLVGFTVYSQSVCLIPPNSLPNGMNAFGLTTSNGIKTFISDI
jgi:hypothetical protein